MTLLWRIAKIALVALLVVVLALSALTGWLIVRGFPQREGTARLPGLSDVVRIVRDAHGIAHIYAATIEDLFAAQGYLHASERMWQMEVWRRIGMGRLAELFGESQVDTDRFIRTLGWRQAAAIDLAEMSAEGQLAMDSYARGVNAWLEQHHDLPIQFVIAGLQGPGGGLSGFRPEPWTPLDSLIWQKVQAWSLGGNWEVELFRLLLERRGLTADQVATLFPVYDPARPVVVPTTQSARPATVAERRASSPAPSRPALSRPAPSRPAHGDLARLLDLNDELRRHAGLLAGGSNAIAVAPDRSAGGGALLANDPHLGISMPSVWFLVGLHCNSVGPECPYDVVGAGFPGGPGVVLGHNRHIAWGLTNVGPDVQDLFEETLDPDTPGRYIHRGQSRLFDVRPEVIGVAGGEPVEIEVRSSIHGPIISDVAIQLRPAADGGHELGRPDRAYALAWTAISEPDGTFDAVLAVNRAATGTSFGPPCAASLRHRRPSSTPTSKATSACRSRAVSPSGRRAMGRCLRRVRMAATTGSAGCRSTSCPPPSTLHRASSYRPTTCPPSRGARPTSVPTLTRAGAPS
jgi:penicillin G amidase